MFELTHTPEQSKQPVIDVKDLREAEKDRIRAEFRQKVRAVRTGQEKFQEIKVKNSHDYIFLLRLYTNYLKNHGKPLNRRDHILQALEHENFHTIPALAQEELGIGVSYSLTITRRRILAPLPDNPNIVSVSRREHVFEMYPSFHLSLPEKIDALTPEGQQIAVIIFESLLNPALASENQELSDVDVQQAARFWNLFTPFPDIYSNFRRLMIRLPPKEMMRIMDKTREK